MMINWPDDKNGIELYRMAKVYAILTGQKPMDVITWCVRGQLQSIAEQGDEFTELAKRKFKEIEGEPEKR